MINTAADTAAELVESKSNVAKELKERLGDVLKKLEAMVKELEAYELRYARFVSMVGA
jgi:Mg2+ and Co2+ transporter CorA